MNRLPILLLLLVACAGKGSENPFAKQLANEPYREWTEKINKDPEQDTLYYRRALLLMENGQLEAARYDLEKAWSIRPTPIYGLLLAQTQEADPAKQLLFLKEATHVYPNDPFLQLALAQAYQAADSTDAALTLTERLTQSGLSEPELMLLHANLLRQKGRIAEALQQLETLYASAPEPGEVAEMLALWYAESGNEKIIPLCQQMKAADSSNTDPLPHYYMGIFYATRKQIDRALQAFDQAIQADYHFVEAYIEKASLQYDRRSWNLALKELDKALAVAPDHAAVYYWTAKCQQAQGDTESAKANYLKAYGLDNTFLEAKQAADQLK